MAYYGDERTLAPVIKALDKNDAHILRVLAEFAPLCGDAGFKCWDVNDLMEIVDRLEKK